MANKNLITRPEVREIQSECLVIRYHHKKRPMHEHNGIELAYVLRGEATHVIREPDGTEKRMNFSEGNYVILDYNTAHAYVNCSSNFLLINILFRPELLHQKSGTVHSFEDLIQCPMIGFDYAMLREKPVNRHFVDENKQQLLLFEKAHKVFDKNITGGDQLLQCYVIEIIITTLQKMLSNTPAATSDTLIASICDYVDIHYQENVTLTQICQTNYFSIPYISKRFKKVCGVNFEQYLKQVRIHHACTLLLETGMSIDAIANHVNYTDVASFRNTFKRLIGKSPSNFRKSFTKPAEAEKKTENQA